MPESGLTQQSTPRRCLNPTRRHGAPLKWGRQPRDQAGPGDEKKKHFGICLESAGQGPDEYLQCKPLGLDGLTETHQEEVTKNQPTLPDFFIHSGRGLQGSGLPYGLYSPNRARGKPSPTDTRAVQAGEGVRKGGGSEVI